MSSTQPTHHAPADDVATRNRVRLVGRLSTDPHETVLPSGDRVVSVRVVVARGPRERRPPTVDTIDCAIWTAALRRRALRWAAGDVVLIDGRLRRRFWRTPTGPASRYEVEVTAGRRMTESVGEQVRKATVG